MFDSHTHTVLATQKADPAPRSNSVICASFQSEWYDLPSIITKHNSLNSDQYHLAMGIHPWNLKKPNGLDIDRLFTEFIQLFWENNCSIIGEVGLDKTIHDMDLQVLLLRKILVWNSSYNHPVCLHTVRAWDELFKLISEFPEQKMMIHNFAGNTSLLTQFSRFENLYFSFKLSAPLSLKSLQAAKLCALDKLLIETDNTKEKHSNFIELARFCDNLDISIKELETITTTNCFSLFNV